MGCCYSSSSSSSSSAAAAVGVGVVVVGAEAAMKRGGMWVDCSTKSTRTASLYSHQGKKGINQDAMLFWEENLGSRGDAMLCGVFDGHGPFGHMVSKTVRDSLPLFLYTHWKPHSVHGPGSEETTSSATPTPSLEENKRLPETCREAVLKAFKQMDEDLNSQTAIDCFSSGTTAVTLIKQGQDLIIGNVGDSRAVLATRDKDKTLIAIQLTVDLKPDLPKEAARIEQCRGRVFALQDEPEVARVWLPNCDSPGLAMARAFGDFCLKDFGLISIPEVYYHRLTSRDEFVILATDGVWDVLSNKEAVDVVASAPSRATAARALVDSAVRAWKLKYPTSKTDDCTAVCLFLEHSTESNDSTQECSVPEVFQSAEERPQAVVLGHLGIAPSPDEIVPVLGITEVKPLAKTQLEPKKTLAECISSADDDEWSALEGFTRVNSLLSLPRFLSRDKRKS